MLFALICTDKPGSLDIRTSTRPQHIEFLNGLGNSNMNGSLVIIDANDMADAKAIAARDPYARAGLFQSVDIRPWLWRIKNPETP